MTTSIQIDNDNRKRGMHLNLIAQQNVYFDLYNISLKSYLKSFDKDWFICRLCIHIWFDAKFIYRNWFLLLSYNVNKHNLAFDIGIIARTGQLVLESTCETK